MTMTKPPDAHRHQLLERLYLDARKGRNGADLQVQCPSVEDPDKLQTFYLHLSIASSCSGYFATFPEPQSRVIQEIDAEMFDMCRKFMYLGDVEVDHSTVSSLLAAAQLFLLVDLSAICFDYLEQNIDHSNYKTVIELADHFHNAELRHTALRYSVPNVARDELVAKKMSLASEIRGAEQAAVATKDLKQRLMNALDGVEKQWTEIIQKDLETKVSAGDQNIEASLSYPSEKYTELGAVGRLVADPDSRYGTFSTYRAEGVDTKEEQDVDCDSGDESSYENDANTLKPPPPPTKEEYEELGIMYSYGTLREALEASKPGDRIFLRPGTHCYSYRNNFDIYLDKSQEIIGLGDPGEVIIRSPQTPIISVTTGCVRLSNITFEHSPTDCRESCNEALIMFDGGDDDNNAKLFVQDCNFEMGTNAVKAHSWRISGINLSRGKAAIIKRCSFVGGGGSAVTIVNDPYSYVAKVELLHNSFVSTGQPSFKDVVAPGPPAVEISTGQPSFKDAVAPGPAAVEMWRVRRKCYRSRRNNSREVYNTTELRIEGNRFSQNMRAALAYRSLVARYGGVANCETGEKAVCLYTDLAGIDLNAVTSGYNLILSSNTMEDNGLEFDRKSVSSWIGVPSSEKIPKRMRTEEDTGEPRIPNGESLLAIKQVVGDHSRDKFPTGFGDDHPSYSFRRLFFTEDGDSEASSEDESDSDISYGMFYDRYY
eukprot:scaffold215917_cov58-Attheya_sp.AAC.1